MAQRKELRRQSVYAGRALGSAVVTAFAFLGFAPAEAVADEDTADGMSGMVAAAEDEAASAAPNPGMSGKKQRTLGLGGPDQGVAHHEEEASPPTGLEGLLPNFPGAFGPLPGLPSLPGGIGLLDQGGQGVAPAPAAPAPAVPAPAAPAPAAPVPAPAPAVPAPAEEGLAGALGMGHPSSGSSAAHPNGSQVHEEGAQTHEEGSVGSGAALGSDHHASAH